MELDGSNDFVEITDPGAESVLDVTDEITLSACIKIDADTNTHQGVIAKWNSPGDDRSYEIVLLRESDGELRPEMFINTSGEGSGNIGVRGSIGIDPGDGAWHHVAGTFKSDPAGGDTVTDEVKVYLDGNLIGTADAPDDAMIHDSSTPVLIGAENVAPTLFFNGKIDEVRIYDVALTQDQLNTLSCGTVDGLRKGLTSGPDADSDGRIDVVVGVGQLSKTEYDFTMSYVNPSGPDVLIVDTAPAEWIVTEIEGDATGDGPDPLPVDPRDLATFSNDFGDVDVFKTGKGAKSKSSTKILWTPDPNGGEINVLMETRQSPGKKNVKFAPTSCGPLFLNSGPAEVFELDESGDPLDQPPLFTAEPLCLAAVKDLDGGGLVEDGSGDEDGDGLTDLAEACTIGTNPCNPDTDNDGVPDGVDSCPLEGPANAGVGEILEGNGCIRQSQCSDGVDNADQDGFIDWVGVNPGDIGMNPGDADPQCMSIIDDDESS